MTSPLLDVSLSAGYAFLSLLYKRNAGTRLFFGATAIVNIYSQRMGIEQQFRDTKNATHGMGLAQSKSRGRQRLQALLLIAHIAAMAKRLIGEAAEAAQLQLQLMSNNIKSRKTISMMTLATRMIERPDLLKMIADARPCIYALRQQAAAATGGAGAGL